MIARPPGDTVFRIAISMERVPAPATMNASPFSQQTIRLRFPQASLRSACISGLV